MIYKQATDRDFLLHELVKKILDDPLKFKWTIQGFGMLRLYMENGLRMTLWLKKFRVPQVSMMHTHPWNFSSYIVAGRMVNRKFRLAASGGGFRYFVSKIKAGEGGGLEGDPEMVYLEALPPEIVCPGETYSQKFEELHVSDPEDGTITLCHRVVPKDNSPDHALVFWPEGYHWVSAEPGPAAEDVVEEFAQAARSRLEEVRLV